MTAPICASSMNYLEIIFPNPNSNPPRDKAAPLLNGGRSSDSTNVCIFHAFFTFGFGTKQLGFLTEEEAVTAPIFASSNEFTIAFYCSEMASLSDWTPDSQKTFKKSQNS